MKVVKFTCMKKDKSQKVDNWKIIKYKNIKIYFSPSIDGGGTTFGQDFIPVIKAFGKVNRLCEFASGPGFIGFSLLANGLCKSLCLIDINPNAIKACQKTIETNNLQDRVKVYRSNVLDNVPKNEKWDLVVSNPPHFNGSVKDYKENIMRVDPNWEIHKKFYKNISKHLTKNASIIFQENIYGSYPKLWKNMVIKCGLYFVKTFYYKPSIYEKVSRGLKLLYSNFGLDIIQYIKSYFLNRKIKKVLKIPTHEDYPFYFVLIKNRIK